MRVWHTNTEDPTASRQSAIPISPEPQPKGVTTECEGGNFDDIAPVVGAVPARPKRKRGNDSVSQSNVNDPYQF